LNADLSELLFLAAQLGMATHILCTIALRFSIEVDSPLFEELFAFPILGGITKRPWLLRAKYFIPWVATPEDLVEYTVWVQALFWGARLGGTLLALGFVGFLFSFVYIVVSGQ
jgi:hypothetical protein